MRQTIERLTCDACGKVLDVAESTSFGGDPRAGWIFLTEMPTHISESRHEFCSHACCAVWLAKVSAPVQFPQDMRGVYTAAGTGTADVWTAPPSSTVQKP